MPQTLETINGSCVLIPCSFTTKESVVTGPATGVWRKGSQWFKDSVDVFNSSKTSNILRGEILGDLTQRNCTSVLYGFTKAYEDKYFFRLESSVTLTFTESVSIKVNDALPKPYLTLPLSIQEGVLVSMTCAISSPCLQDPPTLTWSPQLNHSREILRTKEDGTPEVVSELRFMPSSWDDGLSVSCVATHHEGVTPVRETVQLTVLYGPKNLSVSLHDTPQLEMGSPITLYCLGVSKPPIDNYRWFRNTRGYLEEMDWTSQNFTFNVTHSGSVLYHCEGRNSVGAANSSGLELEMPVSAGLHLKQEWWWPLIAGAGAGFILLVAVLYKRHKNLQSKQSKRWELDLKGKVVDPDIYINVTEETLRRAAGPSEPDDSVYCNQFQPDSRKTKNCDFLSDADDAIYANH
ncbi:myelin-associated glycoprotein-like isoform X2 [Sardina pilchardus]